MMTITRVCRLAAFLLFAIFVLPLRAGDPAEIEFQVPKNDPEPNVIIEFAERPLLDRLQQRSASSTTLDSLLQRLERDLDRIEGRTERLATQAGKRSVRFRYKLTFAGASTRVRRESLAAIRALPYVKAVHMDRKLEKYLVHSVPHIGAPKVWEELGVRGRGVVVAILDTGIDYNHNALGKGFGPGFKVAGGYDFINDDADPMDDQGHGTHVAGIVSGDLAPVLGVAPAATLLAYKVLDAEGSGELSTVLAGVERAMDPNGDGDPSDHADVVNMSLGGPRSLDDPLVQAVERAVAAGVVFAVAAGNARDHGTIGSPGVSPSAITVGSVDGDDVPSYFTSRGPVGPTWIAKPEVAAPGENIDSARRGGGTARASGTSMAAPHVAGVAALLLERHPDWTPEDVKAAIVSTAKPVFTTDYTFDPRLDPTVARVLSAGAGRVDARRAADASILPSPAALSFGIVAKQGEPWTATRTVRLSNRGSAAETLTIGLTNLPEGATVTANPSTVTIDPGATAEVTLTLNLARNTPLPNEDGLAISGALELTGAKSSLRVPWSAVNVPVLTITLPGTDPFVLGVLQGSQLRPYWLEDERTLGTFVGFPPVDVFLLLQPEADKQLRMIIREELYLTGHTHLTLTAADAPFKLSYAAVDERGVPFAERAAPGTGNGTILHYVVGLPGTANVAFTVETARELWVSPLPKTSIKTYDYLLTKSDRYAGMYPIQRGVKQSETIEIRPADWASQTIQHHCQTECELFFGAGTGSPVSSFFPFFPVPPGGDTWTLHVTPPLDDAKYFRSHFFVREKTLPMDNPRLSAAHTYISPPFRNEDGQIKAAPLSRPTPIDYASPSPYRAMPIGDGPIVLRMAMNHTIIELQPHDGLLGATHGENLLKIQMTKYGPDGNPVGHRELTAGLYAFPRHDPGPYRIEATDEYRIAGRVGRVTQTSRGDEKVYTAAPTLVTLRVEDGSGAAVTTVPAGNAARLLFSARQSTFEGPGNIYLFHYPVDAAATRVWSRPHGTADWQPLAVEFVGEDREFSYDEPGPAGTMFSSDLRALTATPGEIDLKISLTNPWGATTEAVYEPAFLVEPTRGKRRSVR